MVQRFCAVCGAELGEGIKFCEICGTPIDEKNIIKTSSPSSIRTATTGRKSPY